MGAKRNEMVSLASELLTKHFRAVLANQLERVGRQVRIRGGGNIQRQLRVAEGGGGPRAREVDQIKGITHQHWGIVVWRTRTEAHFSSSFALA